MLVNPRNNMNFRKTVSGLQQKSLFLHLPAPFPMSEDYLPAVRLNEDDMEDTIPGLGAWEEMSQGLELGEEVPFPLTRRLDDQEEECD